MITALRCLSKSCDRITPIYRRLQILKLNDLYKVETAKFIHQLLDKSLPASFKKYFTRTSFIFCSVMASLIKRNLSKFALRKL